MRQGERAQTAETAGTSLSHWIDDVQNLQVRDALRQVADNWTVVVVGLSIAVLVILALGGVFRPSGVGGKIRDVKAFPAFVWFFVGVLILLMGPMSADAIGRLPGLYSRVSGPELSLDELDMEALRLGGAAFVGSVVGLALVYLLRKSGKDAGLQIGGLDLMFGFGCFLLAIPLVQLATIGGTAFMRQVLGEAPPEIAHETLRLIVDNRGHRSMWAIILAVTVGAPIVEELVFRMGLQSALLRLFGNPWPAILLTSLAFAGLHSSVLPAHAWHALATLFVLSMCLGVAFERTGRLGVPIAMHIAFNTLNVVLALQAVPASNEGVERTPQPEILAHTPDADP